MNHTHLLFSFQQPITKKLKILYVFQGNKETEYKLTSTKKYLWVVKVNGINLSITNKIDIN